VSHGKTNFFLFNQFARKKGVFNIWKNSNFWLKFIEFEMNDKKIKPSDQTYWTILMDIVFRLNDLNLDNNIIMSLVSDDLAIKLIKNVIEKI